MKRVMLLVAVVAGLSGCLGGEETEQPCDVDAGHIVGRDGGAYNPAIVCAMSAKYQNRTPGAPCYPACRDVVDQKADVICQCPGGGDNCNPSMLVWQSLGDGGVNQ